MNERNKTISVYLLIIMIGISFCFVFSTNVYAEVAEQIDVNEYIVQLKQMKIEIDENEVIIKELTGFDGREYILLEGNSKGYYIFNKTNKVFLEGSNESISPYKNKKGELYYGGCLEYGYKSEDEIVNIFQERKYSLEELKQIETKQNKIYNDSQHDKFIKTNKLSNYSSSSSSTAGTTIMVDNASSIGNLNTGFGYVNGGYCGYIAAAILISYNYHSKNLNWVPSGDYLDPQTGGPSTKLTNKLISIGQNEYGQSGGTISTDIKKVVSYYCDYYVISYNQTSLYTPVANFSKIKSHISNDHAVIIFGNMPEYPNSNKVNHAVLCYGVLDGALTDYYYVHYGWSGYSSVMVAKSNIIIGSMYSCW